MNTLGNDFDFLDSWALMSDEDIRAVAFQETTRVLHRLSQALLDEEQLRRLTVDVDNVAAVVRMLRKIKHESSRALGDAIAEANDLLDDGETEEAIKVYQRFHKECASPYYRAIALDQIRKIGKVSK